MKTNKRSIEIDSLLKRLKDVRYDSHRRRWTAPCPAHEGKNRSLSVLTYEGGIVLWCFHGCTVEKICKVLRINLAELLKPELPPSMRAQEGNPKKINWAQHRLRDALAYAKRHWPVFPLHTLRNGRCTCGKDCGKDAGKHPRTAHGVKDATTDQEKIRAWWEDEFPGSNIGIATGTVSRLFVLDIDPRHGGNETLSQLTSENGPLPKGAVVKTGGGGEHWYFNCPDSGIRSRNGILPGLDVRGDGGYVVAPSSFHFYGKHYRWSTDTAIKELQVPDAPDWLLNLCREPSLRNTGLPDELANSGSRSIIKDGVRNSSLTSMAGSMRRCGFDQDAILAALLEHNVAHCRPPLDEREVASIAKSVARYAPGALPFENSLAVTQAWPEMEPAAFQGLAGDIVRLIEPATEADPNAILIQSLVAFGNAVGPQGPHFMVEATPHYTNIFCVLVGQTSKARKGTSFRHVSNIFSEADPEWFDSCVKTGLSSGEGLIHAVRDPTVIPKKVKDKNGTVHVEDVETDRGAENKRLLVVEEEFTAPLKIASREGNTLSAIIRLAWDGKPLEVLVKNYPEKATGAHVSIIGHVTKDDLIRHLDYSEIANGFANRFLWACARRSKYLPDGGKIDPEALQDVVERTTTAVEFAKQTGRLPWTEKAHDLWLKEYIRLAKGEPGLVGAVIVRAEAQVVRLAMIYALMDLSSKIQTKHLRAAIALWEYCDASARYIFGNRLGNPVADEILRALRGAEAGLTRTEISNLFSKHQTTGQIGSALMLLSEQGLATCKKEQTEGRPSERWYYSDPAKEAKKAG